MKKYFAISKRALSSLYQITKMKIKKLTYSLTINGFGENMLEFECHKTKGGYIVDAESPFGGKTTRITNEAILNIDSMVVANLFHIISFYCWYFEPDEQKAKSILMKRVREEAMKRKDTCDKLISLLPIG